MQSFDPLHGIIVAHFVYSVYIRSEREIWPPSSEEAGCQTGSAIPTATETFIARW